MQTREMPLVVQTSVNAQALSFLRAMLVAKLTQWRPLTESHRSVVQRSSPIRGHSLFGDCLRLLSVQFVEIRVHL